MATSSITVVFQALTWVFQIMPVFYYLAFWVSALAILRYFLPEHVYEPVAGISIQLLWFLGAYVLVLAAVPLLSGMLGVAYRRHLLAGRAALLLGIETQQLKNMTPPSLLLVGHAIILCALAIAAATVIARWARRPRVWWLTALVAARFLADDRPVMAQRVCTASRPASTR